MSEALRFEHYPYPHRLPMQVGPYHLIELLGQGGMGAVFRAYREGASGQRFDVAVKVVRDTLLAGGDDLAQGLAREAEIARKLSHPNVLQVQDFGVHHGIPYIVTDLLQGQSAEELAQSSPLSPRQAVRLVMGLVRGLAYMHTQSPPLVHRDVKPSNAFVTLHGEVKVLDFGLSKALSPSSHSMTASSGTTAYLAPERYLGKALPQSDVFSVGAVIYELVVGKRLFDGSEFDPDSGTESEPNVFVAIDQVRHSEQHLLKRDAVAAVESRVPGLGAIFFRCMRDDPAQRFADCAALEQALEPLDHNVGQSLRSLAQPRVKARVEVASVGLTTAPKRAAGLPGPPPVDRIDRARAPKSEVAIRKPRPWLWVFVALLVVGGGVGAALALKQPSTPAKATAANTPSASAPPALAASANPQPVAAVAAQAPAPFSTVPLGFIRVEPGSFMMGSPDSEPGHESDERQRQVTIDRPFFLQRAEVTQQQWRQQMGTSPSYCERCDLCPIERVSWFDAAAFANKLSGKGGLSLCYELIGCTGEPGQGCPGGDQGLCEGTFTCNEVRFAGLDCDGYRLPTEAEWEYAARAGTTTALYNGALKLGEANERRALDPIGWYRGNATCTQRVAQKEPNAWGFYDMLGNVAEWTWDLYPGDIGAEARRIIKGGSYFHVASDLRAGNRLKFKPSAPLGSIGFRLARSAR